MPEPVFLVEGQMEKRIVQELCKGKPVRLIGCNGDDVSISAIAKAIDARLRLLGGLGPVIIILDRERRHETCDQLIQQLSQHLDARHHHGKYVIGIADRTIENWILSDWTHIVKQDPRYKALDSDVQGQHGKTIIRKLMPPNTLYHETTIGVELFLKCRPDQIFSVNQSFRTLISQLRIECWWLNTVHARFEPTSWSKPSGETNSASGEAGQQFG